MVWLIIGLFFSVCLNGVLVILLSNLASEYEELKRSRNISNKERDTLKEQCDKLKNDCKSQKEALSSVVANLCNESESLKSKISVQLGEFNAKLINKREQLRRLGLLKEDK